MRDVEIFIGWDPRERLAWNVCARSIIAQSLIPPVIQPIGMATLGDWYKRPTERRDGVLYDMISDAPMATAFALARFFVPFVAKARWALFVDGDFLFRSDVAEIFAYADPRYAVQVVKHQHLPVETVKMDGQVQTAYARKNWSSLILWNLTHTANNRRLWAEEANTQPGLWLHQFGWLKDHEIGELPVAWNWLEGSSASAIEPKAVHYTRGTPDMIDGRLPYQSEWLQHVCASDGAALELDSWARLENKKVVTPEPYKCALADCVPA